MKVKYVVLISSAIVFATCVVLFFKNNLTPYVSFEQAKQSAGPVQVIGDILHQQTTYDLQLQRLKFVIEDYQKNRLMVQYAGTKPGNFDEAKSAVVIGQYRDGLFLAENVLVKCPSKYQGREPG